MSQQPTQADIRRKNAAFANAVKAGKTAVKPNPRDAQKKSPVGLWALGAIVFVVCGSVIFELIKLIFL
ncbi:hypothetical protein BOTBODRAFT_176490 [Botryobasidium botryosum FD-172 SS1]|uniref:Stress-associated endoplasmic reticulum protein n=1 Tax=Botryobasidium botryosum (strain FD-172 SS1) TaxID=930990 RepID=A0A067MC26_BOTB1|nr:hypothetical protein BOTBODRAFT_176490 [Botryobasidium botryosum FD-172 SS1]